MSIMALETGRTFSPSIQNKDTHATGLVQIMPNNAKNLGTTIEKLKAMTAVEQLDYVEKWFLSMEKTFLTPNGKGLKDIKDEDSLYMVVFNPANILKPPEHILYSLPSSLNDKKECQKQVKKGGYCANVGLDIDGDNTIRKSEAGKVIRDLLQEGLTCKNVR